MKQKQDNQETRRCAAKGPGRLALTARENALAHFASCRENALRMVDEAKREPKSECWRPLRRARMWAAHARRWFQVFQMESGVAA